MMFLLIAFLDKCGSVVVAITTHGQEEYLWNHDNLMNNNDEEYNVILFKDYNSLLLVKKYKR